MRMGWWRRAAWLLAFGALGGGALAAEPLGAQQTDTEECRCVDRDGDEIEDCTCFRLPRMEAMVRSVMRVRPRLGVSVSTSQGSGMDAQGALVTRVMEDGPADEAGITEDDIITSIDGQSLFEPLPGDAEEDFDLDASIPVQRLLAIARELEPGQQVEIEYLRGGQAFTTTVEAEELSRRGLSYVYPEFDGERLREQMRELREELRGLDLGSERFEELQERMRERDWSFRFDQGYDPNVVIGGGPVPYVISGWGLARYGLQMIELTPGLGEYFGVAEGVLVTDVDEDSTLGLQPGDVVLRVGDRDVTSPQRVRRILSSYSDDEEILFRVQRDGAQIDVMGRLDD